jgi:EAL domain-containing protein (putative c-di-GMP-specific phosphodiesterase class I)
MEPPVMRHTDSRIAPLLQGVFTMVFQPIVETQTGKIMGFEALMRGTRLSPTESPERLFSEMGCPDDLLQLDIGCIGSALRSGRVLASNYRIFINAHSVTLRELALNFDAFLKLLQDLGINPDRIVFEISEKTDQAGASAIQGYLGEFIKSGIRIAIDDVGDSFKWLHHMLHTKPTYLKVDRSHIHGINVSTRKQALVRSLHLMCCEMGLKVIAEGIESHEQLCMLNTIGIPFAQGFWCGRPESVDGWIGK